MNIFISFSSIVLNSDFKKNSHRSIEILTTIRRFIRPIGTVRGAVAFLRQRYTRTGFHALEFGIKITFWFCNVWKKCTHLFSHFQPRKKYQRTTKILLIWWDKKVKFTEPFHLFILCCENYIKVVPHTLDAVHKSR